MRTIAGLNALMGFALVLSSGCGPSADRADAAVPEQGVDVIARAMREQRERDRTEWTATNISAHPDLYLVHCRKLLEDYAGRYQAAVLKTRVALNACDYDIQAAEREIGPLKGFFPLAQSALAAEDRTYPKKVGVYIYDSAEDVKSAVLKTDRVLRDLESRIVDENRKKKTLGALLAELEAGQKRVKAELKDMDRKETSVKADLLKRQAAELAERMNALLAGVAAVTPTGPEVGRAPQDAPASGDGVAEVFARRLSLPSAESK